MTIALDLQFGPEIDAQTQQGVPGSSLFQRWVEHALTGRRDEAELTIRVVGVEEGSMLNQTYRHKVGPTNVLSFPFECPPGVVLPLLGDLVICAPVVIREADQQGKPPVSHWAHMVIHGVLHLLGYDHIEEDEAELMEGLEIDLLAGLGYADPYHQTGNE